MFEKLDAIGVIVPIEVQEELTGYLDLIKDKHIRLQIESAIIGNLKKFRNNDTLECRLICLYAMFNYMGLSVRTSRARRCSVRFCNYVMKFFVSLDYEMFSLYNRRVMYQIDDLDDYIVDGLLAYHCSKYFDKDVFSSAINISNTSILMHRVDRLAAIYPDAPLEKVVECVTYYMEPRSFFKFDDDILLNLVDRLVDLGLDFFDYTDKIHSYGEEVGTIELTVYLNNASIIKNCEKLDFECLFGGDIPSPNDLSAIVHGINRGIVIPVATYKSNPVWCQEYIYWKGDNLPIEDYVKAGYNTVGKLRIIRYLLQNNRNPADFSIDPSMSAVVMRRNVDLRLQLSPGGRKRSGQRRAMII